MKLGKFNKTPAERKRYSVSYDQWLDTGETITAAAYVSSPLTTFSAAVDSSTIDVGGRGITFFISGGLDGTDYTIDIQITTSGGQIKEDTLLVSVRNP